MLVTLKDLRRTYMVSRVERSTIESSARVLYNRILRDVDWPDTRMNIYIILQWPSKWIGYNMYLFILFIHHLTPTSVLAHLQDALLLRYGTVFTRPFPRAPPSRARQSRGWPGGTQTHASAVSAPKSSVLPLDYPGHHWSDNIDLMLAHHS